MVCATTATLKKNVMNGKTNSMLDKALETNSTQFAYYRQRLKEIEAKLKEELILTSGEISGLEIERLQILKTLKEKS